MLKGEFMGGGRYIRILQELESLLTGEDERSAIAFLKEKISQREWPEDKKATVSKILTLPETVKKDPHAYALFCDGACRGNPGPGSWYVIVQDNTENILIETSGVDMNTTNNKMELSAAIHGMEETLNYWIEEKNAHGQIHLYIYSDSKYLVEGMTKWVVDWKARGWKKADKKAPENLDLWQHLDQLASNFKKISFHWVQGHAGHPQNEYCDTMANKVLDEAGY
jgi:ribonuclease HI